MSDKWRRKIKAKKLRCISPYFFEVKSPEILLEFNNGRFGIWWGEYGKAGKLVNGWTIEDIKRMVEDGLDIPVDIKDDAGWRWEFLIYRGDAE